MSNRYEGLIIRNTRNTVGGSILVEFDDEDEAEKMMKNWDKDLFGGNEGLIRYKPQNTSGILKQVEKLDEDEILEEIEDQYQISHVELFKKEERFTGTVKVIFKDEENLERALKQKMRIRNQIYIVERFNPKPKVIKCHTCQKFGHVSRLCRNKDHPVCGKCSSTKHETKHCQVEEDRYKCAHCDGVHVTGSYKCVKMKEQLAKIQSRGNVY